MILPGVLSGALLAFTLSIDDFIITFFTNGPGSTTLPIYVFGLLRRVITPQLNALSTVWIVIVLIAVFMIQRMETAGLNFGYPAASGWLACETIQSHSKEEEMKQLSMEAVYWTAPVQCSADRLRWGQPPRQLSPRRSRRCDDSPASATQQPAVTTPAASSVPFVPPAFTSVPSGKVTKDGFNCPEPNPAYADHIQGIESVCLD